MTRTIKKASGDLEPFDTDKLQRSLEKTGADKKCINRIVKKIEAMHELKSTKEIYDMAMHYLKKEKAGPAARYNLKQALRELGPSGFPFEHFVANLFRAQGYDVEVGKIVPGWCVDHEVDALAVKNKQHFMIECKFHKHHGLKTSVKTALYIKARFDDINKKLHEDSKQKPTFNQAWIVTNTKFTSQAIIYGNCAGISLLGWSYPHKKNLQNLIDELGVHPITALTSLTHKEKKKLIKSGLVLCRDAKSSAGLLRNIGFSTKDINKLIEESEKVCHRP